MSLWIWLFLVRLSSYLRIENRSTMYMWSLTQWLLHTWTRSSFDFTKFWGWPYHLSPDSFVRLRTEVSQQSTTVSKVQSTSLLSIKHLHLITERSNVERWNFKLGPMVNNGMQICTQSLVWSLMTWNIAIYIAYSFKWLAAMFFWSNQKIVNKKILFDSTRLNFRLKCPSYLLS